MNSNTSLENKKSGKKFSDFYFVVFFVLINAIGFPQQENLLDNTCNQLFKELITSEKQCFSLTGVKNDSIIYFKGFGNIDRKRSIPIDTSTIFRLGSVTKTFTAVLMMKLVEEGYFKLDDPIEKYLPEIKQIQGYTNSTQITFKQLASHTSGLAREPSTSQDLQYCFTSEWESKILLAIPLTNFAIKPNTAMLYSNIGYNILGLAMSRAAKISFMELITNKVFVPLGMNHSCFEIPDNEINKLALSAEFNKEQHTYKAWKVASGGIYSTAKDLTKFISMLMGVSKEKIISDKSLAILKHITSKNNNSVGGYGMGLMIYDWNEGTKIFGHNGVDTWL